MLSHLSSVSAGPIREPSGVVHKVVCVLFLILAYRKADEDELIAKTHQLDAVACEPPVFKSVSGGLGLTSV